MPSPAEPRNGRTQYTGRSRRERPWLWFPVFLYAAAIFIVSGMSRPPLPGGLGGDKSAHMAAYTGFGLLTLRAVAGAEWAGVTAARCIMAAGLAVVYGASDEMHQAFVPGRTADIHDLAADAAGATGGVAAMWLLARVKRSGRVRSEPS